MILVKKSNIHVFMLFKMKDGKGIYYSNKLEKSRAAFWSNGQEIKKEISDL
jgi:hypothetical protein